VNTKETAVIILAAGNGTRMKSSLPKVLHEVCGKSMIGHVIDTASYLNPARIITVVSKNMAQVEKVIADVSEIAIQKEQLGTADAIKPGLEKLKGFKGNVLILYADTPLVQKSTLLNMLKKLEDSDVVVLGFRPHDAAEYGRLIVDGDGCLKKITEYKDASPFERAINLCNSGVVAANAETMAELVAKVDNKNAKGEYYLTDIVEIANAMGKKCSFAEGDEDEVLGVNNRVQLSEVEYIFQQRLREAAMLEGVTLRDPETVYFSYDTKLGRDVIIQPNVTFGRGVVIGDNVEIKSFCHIEDARIDADAIVGPFTRIRPGTEIAKGAHIGNFVEIKKSQIGEGVKIGHLTYIGDAEIGANTNIGAGTVTCNYDGKNKHKTEIGKSVFVGSNTSFVAPVKVGHGAFIGAGSTITKDVDEDCLAVARGRQVVKENWAKGK
jgi:bifunctional UDP-N-acetylglucosamine pyrophosphorylase/glucosamine-1-phosphate N-acetyltransferase